MPHYHNSNLAGAGGQGGAYEVEQSLRFNSADSTYLYRTPSSAGNQRTWTWSVWLKRGSLGTEQNLFTPQYGGDGSNENQLQFLADDTFRIYDSGGSWLLFDTSQVFRDASAWFHLVIAVDTTQATSTDRFKLYINGVQVTVFDQSLYPVQDRQLGWNSAVRHDIGRYAQGATKYFNGYMAEFHMVDGTALDPTSFGEFDENGVWRPIEVSGLTYGTNGFYLKFDPSATNGIGHDHSGNGNNFTASGFTTSGTGTDVMDDTPTTNWCTLNPLETGLTLSNGNLEYTYTSANKSVRGTVGMSSGKFRWEVKANGNNNSFDKYAGIIKANNSADNYDKNANEVRFNADAWGVANIYGGSTAVRPIHNNSFGTAFGWTWTAGDVLGLYFDATNGTLKANQNGGTLATVYTGLDTTATWLPLFSDGSVASSTDVVNFGQRAFEYSAAESGYSALNTANLPAPDIADGSKNFNTVTYSGDSNTATTISGVGFQPDFVWIKNRTLSGDDYSDHMLFDVIRGVRNYISTNRADQEYNNPVALQEFTVDGFRPGSMTRTNETGSGFVAWNWLAANGTSNITAGSIDGTNPTIASTVSANPSAGFSIVSYTGNGSGSATIAHGLGVKPQMVIVKSRSNSSTYWTTYHESISAGTTYCLELNTRAYKDQVNGTFFGSTQTFNGTVFSVGYPGAASNSTNVNNYTYIAYCFAEVEGYSKFGSFTGNGSSDGPFVYCGFRPAWIILKRATGGQESWQLVDTARRTYNPMTNYMSADTSNGEASAVDFWDQLSNGFKLRNGGVYVNGSGDTYVFAAFAENPFGGSGVSPATAR